MSLNALSVRFNSQVALVDENSSARVNALLDGAFNALCKIELAADKPQMADDFWFDPNDWRAEYRPYVVKDGILQIPVKGVLLHDFPYALGGWATGYPYIWKAFERGMSDPEVLGIALVVDSPGGEVAGNFDLVDKMFAFRGQKPVRAYAAESMYSAAYSIGSVADQIIVSRTGGVGSIGVITAHVDYSSAMEKEGIKVTFITFGKYKADGNPYEPLSKEAEARIQARIDELGEVFVNTVSRNRGMDASSVRATEAATFTATQAKANGLADEIGSLEDSLVAFATDVIVDEEDESMVTQADVDKARADGIAEGKASAATEVEAARKEGATAAHTRISSILGSDEAKKRPTLASHLAFKTDMAADVAIDTLKASAEEKAEQKPETREGDDKDNAFERAMGESENPNVGALGGGDKDLSRAEKAMRLAGHKARRAA